MAERKEADVRLFVPPERLTLPRQPLSAEDQHYLIRVHRLRAGDVFEVFDGKGGSHRAVVDEGLASATLGPRQSASASTAPALELWQGIPKADKLDLIVQKATELGVARLVPLITRHAVRRMTAERLPKLLQRWNRIAAEAARQCGRSDVLEVSAPAEFDAFLARAREGVVAALIYEGKADASFPAFLASRAAVLKTTASMVLAVGPEGGFAPEEVEAARGAGVPLLSLGERILRTETAAIVVCTLARAAFGGFEQLY
jgi:16S rRNA (uracil1498-N3)-methyltransferase